ncbi:MAG: hypothetical protein MZV64_37110 [Ignavibacteriales bacterium]|nr:hypothetical protein [Ignavibacteriales bacterium]
MRVLMEVDPTFVVDSEITACPTAAGITGKPEDRSEPRRYRVQKPVEQRRGARFRPARHESSPSRPELCRNSHMGPIVSLR